MKLGEQMRVVIASDFKEGPWGVHNHVKNLSIALSKKHIDVHIVGIGDEDAAERKRLMLGEEFGFTLHLIKDIDRTLFGKIMTWVFTQYLYYPLLILKEILELKPDIVHIHGNHPPYPVIGVMMRKFFKKIPVIFTVHGVYEMEARYEKPRTGIKRKVNKYFIDKVLAYVPYIIVVSSPLKPPITKITNSKIYIIPNGINLREIQNAEICNHIKVKHPSVFFIGRLERRKGVDILLRAISIIKKEMPEICGYIMGGGPLENELKELTKKLDIEENVNFLGFKSEKEKYSYIKSVDICIIPSRYEPFGIVCLEAMACGKPVVASNVGGLPYVIEDGKSGLLFERGNAKDLANKIIFLLQLQNEDLRNKMGEAGQERAKNFTWDKIAERTLKLYNDVVNN